MKGTPAEQRIQPKPVGAGQQKKKGECSRESTEADAYLAGNLSGHI